jgi:hypothetical protein
MDPNAALALIRDTGSSPEERLEAFEALDGWLSRGGFLPADWDR